MKFLLLFGFYGFFGALGDNRRCYNWHTMESGIVWIRSIMIAVRVSIDRVSIRVSIVSGIVGCRNNRISSSENLWGFIPY